MSVDCKCWEPAMELREPEFMMPLKSAEYIMKNPHYVEINHKGIESIANKVWKAWQEGCLGVDGYAKHELHPKPDDPNAVEWIFVLDTLNFCLWTPENQRKYMVQGHTGYYALCAAIKRALLSRDTPITDASYYATIPKVFLQDILRSDDVATEIPFLQWRLNCLHQVGKVLLEKWEGKFENMLKAAYGSAITLLQLIWQDFPCFRDAAVYDGNKNVTFLKRAQILVADIWSCFGGEGLGEFYDIGQITMFADYRVPQVLCYFGALTYSGDLMRILILDRNLANGDPMEMEIRAASIYAVEHIKLQVIQRMMRMNTKKTKKEKENDNENKNGSNNDNNNDQDSQKTLKKTHLLNAIMIDYFLWDYRRKHAKELEHIPFHKVQTIFY